MTRLARWLDAEAGPQPRSALWPLLGPARLSRRQVLRSLLITLAVMVAFFVLEYAPRDSRTVRAFLSLHLALTTLQAFVSLNAFIWGLRLITRLRQKRRWDDVRVSGDGVAHVFRAGWTFAVYGQAATMFTVQIYLARLILLLLLLRDLSAFRGEYVGMLAGVHHPPLLPFSGVLLLGLSIAAAFVLPVSALGLDAALGLLASTFARSRGAVALVQALAIISRLGIAALCMLAFHNLTTQLDMGMPPQDLLKMPLLLFTGAAADWGVGGLHVGVLALHWQYIPHTAYLGAVLLGLAVLYDILRRVTLRWAIRRASRLD